MNRIPIDRSSESTNLSICDFETVKHIKKVLKSQIGDQLKLTLLNDSLANAKITEIKEASIEVEIIDFIPAEVAQTTLIIGLSRPLTCQKVLEHGTTLGVRKFIFYKAQLSEKSYLDSKLFADKKYKKYLIDGLAQSGIYSQVPEVEVHEKFSDIDLSEFEISNKFLLSLTSQQTMLEASFHKKIKSTLLIGPERGHTNEEEDVFNHLGFQPVTIGKSIQRVEYATASALAQLELLKSK